MKQFEYGRSYKIIHWGTTFDSILELKYALSIHDDYHFLRSHIPVYYDPRTNRPTSYIRDNIRRYTPDFLIRHKFTREAFWIEVKPRACQGSEQLKMRTQVAENYIRWKNYDWKFRIVFDDEITLTAEQNIQYAKCRKLIAKTARQLVFQQMNDRYDESQPRFFSGAPSNKIVQFVMFGTGTEYSIASPVATLRSSFPQ